MKKGFVVITSLALILTFIKADIFQDIGKGFEKTAKDIGGAVEKTVKDVGSAVEKAAEDVSGAVEQTAKDVGSAVEKTAKDVGGAVEHAVQDIGQALEQVGGDVKNNFEKAQRITTVVTELANTSLPNLVTLVESKIAGITKTVGTIESQAQKIASPLDTSTFTDSGIKISEKVKQIFDQLIKKIRQSMNLAASAASITPEVGHVIQNTADIISKIGNGIIGEFDAKAKEDTLKVVAMMSGIVDMINLTNQTMIKMADDKGPMISLIEGFTGSIVNLVQDLENFTVTLLQKAEQAASAVTETAAEFERADKAIEEAT